MLHKALETLGGIVFASKFVMFREKRSHCYHQKSQEYMITPRWLETFEIIADPLFGETSLR